MDAKDVRREEVAKRILAAAKSVCDNDGHGVEVMRVSLLPNGGYTIDVLVPKSVWGSAEMKALSSELEAIEGVVRVLAEFPSVGD